MKVYALIGPSGTGKSYKSLYIAGEKNIEAIIDDGILIKGNKVLAGKSAKKDKTKIAAIKTAVFVDKTQSCEVMDAIKKYGIQSLLILGTSDKMVEVIAKRIHLPEISEKLYIEDVSKPWEIKTARKSRHAYGTHVIPAPTFEIKNSFSGYILHPLKLFKTVGKSNVIYDRSVVRPSYSYMGKYEIKETVIYEIISYEASKVYGVAKAGNIVLKQTDSGLIVFIDISVLYGLKLRDVCRAVQKKVFEEVEYMTALNIIGVNVDVKSLSFKNAN